MISMNELKLKKMEVNRMAIFKLFDSISDMNINGKIANGTYYYVLFVFACLLFLW